MDKGHKTDVRHQRTQNISSVLVKKSAHLSSTNIGHIQRQKRSDMFVIDDVTLTPSHSVSAGSITEESEVDCPSPDDI